MTSINDVQYCHPLMMSINAVHQCHPLMPSINDDTSESVRTQKCTQNINIGIHLHTQTCTQTDNYFFHFFAKKRHLKIFTIWVFTLVFLLSVCLIFKLLFLYVTIHAVMSTQQKFTLFNSLTAKSFRWEQNSYFLVGTSTRNKNLARQNLPSNTTQKFGKY